MAVPAVHAVTAVECAWESSRHGSHTVNGLLYRIGHHPVGRKPSCALRALLADDE
jgi:hypothetical protein